MTDQSLNEWPHRAAPLGAFRAPSRSRRSPCCGPGTPSPPSCSARPNSHSVTPWQRSSASRCWRSPSDFGRVGGISPNDPSPHPGRPVRASAGCSRAPRGRGHGGPLIEPPAQRMAGRPPPHRRRRFPAGDRLRTGPRTRPCLQRTKGPVVGLDHSAVMISQASSRNRRAVAEGRLELVCGGLDRLVAMDRRYDRVFRSTSCSFCRIRTLPSRRFTNASGRAELRRPPTCRAIEARPGRAPNTWPAASDPR